MTATEYLNQPGVAKMLGVSLRMVNQRWSSLDGDFPPDVRVGKMLGWSPERTARFGLLIGLLDERGALLPRNPRHRVRDLTADEAGSLRVRTRSYLSHTEATEVWGRSPGRIFQLRRASRFPDPAVRIGRVSGWEKEQIIRAGQQTGRVDRDGNARPVPA